MAKFTIIDAAGVADAPTYPAPFAVATGDVQARRVSPDTYATWLVDATLAEHVGASLYRIFGALIASVLIGIPAGIAIGVSRIGRGILDPIVEFLRPLPPPDRCFHVW